MRRLNGGEELDGGGYGGGGSGGTFVFTEAPLPVASVSEPATWALLLLPAGLLGLTLAARRRSAA